MPDMSFGDFLNRMTGETSSEKPKKPRPPKREYINEGERPKKKRPLREEEEDKEEKPKKKKEEPKQKENNMPQNSSSGDDIVVKALDYSTRFLKVIYDNFKNEKDRQVVLQSIRSAIDLALGGHSVNAQSITQQNASQPPQQPKKTKPEQQSQATNENIEVKMNDLSGQEVDINPQQYYSQQAEEVQDGSYRKGLNLGLRVNNDGKQEVDLSNVSQHDIHEMRILAGVDPEQKKKEQKQQGFGAGDIESIERGDDQQYG